MGALVSSMRHKGLSVGEVVDKWIGHKGKLLFLPSHGSPWSSSWLSSLNSLPEVSLRIRR